MTTTNASLRKLKKVVGALSIIGWVFYIAALSVLHFARPDPTTIYDTMLGNVAQTEWNLSLSAIFFIFLLLSLLLAVIALILNIALYRAGRTHLWFSVMILLFVSAATGFYFYFNIQ